MDVYFVTTDKGIRVYCQHCADHFIFQGGDVNDVDGPYSDGGGESDTIKHCDRGDKCVRAMTTKSGSVGICFRNDLTPEGVAYTLDALQEYIDGTGGVPEVLDVWAEELRDYTLYEAGDIILDMYNAKRAKEKGSFDAIVDRVSGYRKKQNTKVSSIVAFFDDRPAISKSIHCGSCKDTGVIMLFNRSVECTDCTKSLKNAAAMEVDIHF